MDPRKLYTLPQTLKTLHVAHQTLCKWVLAERLTIVTQKDPKTGRLRAYVTKESVKNARRVTCRFCGKDFQAKHPQLAEYCSIRCRHKAIYARVKARALARKRSHKPV